VAWLDGMLTVMHGNKILPYRTLSKQERVKLACRGAHTTPPTLPDRRAHSAFRPLLATPCAA